MRFSILIPVYNVEQYLEESLDSILNQEFSSYEIVLVDDGSTDRSVQICNKYAANYPDKIRLIRQENKGLLGARRTGISNATGEYCLFLDSDDIFCQGCLQSLEREILESNEPDMVIFNLYYMNNNGTVKQVRKPVFENKHLFDETGKVKIYTKMIEGTYFNQLGFKVIKTNLLQADPTNYEWYYGNSYGEDILQTLYPITRARTVLYLPEAYYGYRLSDTSMIRTFSEESMDKRYNEKLQKLFLEYMKEWGLFDSKNLALYKARTYKVIVDSMMNFIEEDSSLYERVTKYSLEFIVKHSDIKEVLRNRNVSYAARLQLCLFAHGYFKTLLLVRRIAKKACRGN